MTRKNYTLVPVLAAVALIPQFLFWWLAPASSRAHLAVYIGGTLLTVGIPAAFLVTYWNSNLRKTAGLAVVSCALETAVAGLSALLLAVDASVRSAVFAFIITTLVCLIVLIPLISSARKIRGQGVYSAAIPAESDNQAAPEAGERSGHKPGARTQHPVPPHTLRQISAGTPLPPRNR